MRRPTIVLTSLLLACSSGIPAGLKYYWNSDPRSLDPALSTDVPTGEAVTLLFDTLTEFDPDGRLIPGLATRPVRTGETITFYGTGFGPATPGTAPESLVTAPAPLASPVTIRIGGVSASVAYAGQTGSGLYQFNVVVPQVPAGDQRVDADITGIAVTAAMYLTVQ